MGDSAAEAMFAEPKLHLSVELRTPSRPFLGYSQDAISEAAALQEPLVNVADAGGEEDAAGDAVQ